MLERLLPIVLISLGIDNERVIELAQDTKAKREFYFGTLFPKVKEATEAVMLKFDEKLGVSRMSYLNVLREGRRCWEDYKLVPRPSNSNLAS